MLRLRLGSADRKRPFRSDLRSARRSSVHPASPSLERRRVRRSDFEHQRCRRSRPSASPSAPPASRSCRRTAPGDRRCGPVVVHVRRDQVLRHGFDRVDQVAVHVRVAEVQADAERRRVERRPRRSAPASRRATARSGSPRPRSCTPSGSASRCSSSMLRRAASRLFSPGAGCGVARHAQMHDRDTERNAPRDLQRALGFGRARAAGAPRRRSRGRTASPSGRRRSSRRSARARSCSSSAGVGQPLLQVGDGAGLW